MLVVAALGGHALLRRGEPADEPHQRRNIELPSTRWPNSRATSP
jgi:hypothetical protein